LFFVFGSTLIFDNQKRKMLGSVVGYAVRDDSDDKACDEESQSIRSTDKMRKENQDKREFNFSLNLSRNNCTFTLVRDLSLYISVGI
jgi:hypothetical protein